MSIYETIKADMKSAMVNGQKDVRKTLSVFVGDLQTEEKRGTQITDELVVSRLKKSSQSAWDNYIITGKTEWLKESETLRAYIPEQLTAEELSEQIDDIIDKGNDNLGAIMKCLNTTHKGLFDGKEASVMAKQKLSDRK